MIIYEPFLEMGIFAQNGQFKALNISALNVKFVGIMAFIAFSVGLSNEYGFGRIESRYLRSICEDICGRVCCGCGRICCGCGRI